LEKGVGLTLICLRTLDLLAACLTKLMQWKDEMGWKYFFKTKTDDFLKPAKANSTASYSKLNC